MEQCTKEEKQELSTCSKILGGNPGEAVSRSQSSFRRDLRLMCEAAGIAGCHLFLSDDCRFIDTIAKRCCQLTLGISPFDVHIKAIGEVIQELND